MKDCIDIADMLRREFSTIISPLLKYKAEECTRLCFKHYARKTRRDIPYDLPTILLKEIDGRKYWLQAGAYSYLQIRRKLGATIRCYVTWNNENGLNAAFITPPGCIYLIPNEPLKDYSSFVHGSDMVDEGTIEYYFLTNRSITHCYSPVGEYFGCVKDGVFPIVQHSENCIEFAGFAPYSALPPGVGEEFERYHLEQDAYDLFLFSN